MGKKNREESAMKLSLFVLVIATIAYFGLTIAHDSNMFGGGKERRQNMMSGKRGDTYNMMGNGDGNGKRRDNDMIGFRIGLKGILQNMMQDGGNPLYNNMIGFHNPGVSNRIGFKGFRRDTNMMQHRAGRKRGGDNNMVRLS